MNSSSIKLSISTFDVPWMGFMFNFFWLHSTLGTTIKLKASTKHVGFNYETSLGLETKRTMELLHL
jgi:hypothetical protein